MKRGTKKGQESVASSLLTSLENERLEDLLGRRCMVSSGGSGSESKLYGGSMSENHNLNSERVQRPERNLLKFDSVHLGVRMYHQVFCEFICEMKIKRRVHG